MNNMLDKLNERQKEAVLATEGPVLVLAGAGSGKTTVLVNRIAYMISEKHIRPWNILAITFTNKAAREMKDRIERLLGDTAKDMWIGTFHSVCVRILRSCIDLLGYSRDFVIYDTADTKTVMKECLRELDIDEKSFPVRNVLSIISNAKNDLMDAATFENVYKSDYRMSIIAKIYYRYQTKLRKNNAVDFDDIILNTVKILSENPDVLSKYQDKFQYILVDEYQDTNFAQHLIVQRLCERHGHICVVGDDAQSIYSFRGANIDNILQFKNLYTGCRIFKLERNYRSTQNIVNAANSLIDKNTRQIPKTVYSEKEAGNKVSVFTSYSDYEEGYTVAARINEMHGILGKFSYADFAILYRTNAQSRILEEALRKRGIPYKIYGGLSFYQRKEIKDVISYFRMIVNPHDEEALKRIINYPTRGIGDTTVGKLVGAATEYGVSLWTVLQAPLEYSLPINNGTAKKLSDFRSLIEVFIEENKKLSAEELATLVVKRSGIVSDLFQDRSVEGVSKQENLQELLKGIAEFCEIRREEGMEQVAMSDFLAEVSLLTDQDNDKEENSDKVTMMTVHAAKGLEFTNVFVVGLEEDLFPSSLSKDNPRAVEEERRLFYVAITRAEQNCVLSYAKSRYRNGKTDMCTPSRFLKDIDAKYLDMPSDAGASDAFASARERYRWAVEDDFVSPVKQAAQRQGHLTKLKNTMESSFSAAPATDASVLRVGQKVNHDRFGDGEIVSMEGEGGDAKVTVAFKNFGERRLLLKFAKLSVLG